MSSRTLVIIIPAFNEENNIGTVINKIPNISGLNNLVLVIDDGSTDNTANIAKKAGAIVISNEYNLGLGVALRIGLNKALELKGDILAILDGDGQYNPQRLKEFVLPVVNNEADLIVGNRFFHFK